MEFFFSAWKTGTNLFAAGYVTIKIFDYTNIGTNALLKTVSGLNESKKAFCDYTDTDYYAVGGYSRIDRFSWSTDVKEATRAFGANYKCSQAILIQSTNYIVLGFTALLNV